VVPGTDDTLQMSDLGGDGGGCVAEGRDREDSEKCLARALLQVEYTVRVKNQGFPLTQYCGGYVVRILILSLALASSSFAGVILTMDEVPFQPINGLSVTKGGVTFNFTDTTGADYDAASAGQEVYTQDPVIEGQSGSEVITISWSQLFTMVQFGLVLNTQGPISSMATVSLFDGATLVSTSTFSGSQLGSDSFSEGLFTYAGAPVNNIVIAPNSSEASAFGLDNFEVTTPEPSTFAMVAGAGLAMAAVVLKRRKIA
jgi:hypothetical protein